jgi:hypothetical protein
MSRPAENDGAEARLAASGLAVPVDLRDGVLAGCEALVRMTTLLRTVPLSPEDEPANVFCLHTWRDDGRAA